MCFGAKLTAPKKMSAEETKKLNSRSGDDASAKSMNRNYRDASKGESVKGGTKSAPSRSSRPMARGERPSLVSRTISSLSQSISPKG